MIYNMCKYNKNYGNVQDDSQYLKINFTYKIE